MADRTTLSPPVEAALVATFGTVPPLPLGASDARTVRLAIARELFGVPFRDEEELAALVEVEINGVMSDRINRAMLEAFGHGRDLVRLSFVSGPDFRVDDRSTFLDYDRAWHSELERQAGRSGSPAPYREGLYGEYVAWAEGEEIVHGFVYTAGTFLYAALEEVMFSFVRSRYPSPQPPVSNQEELSRALERVASRPSEIERREVEATRLGGLLISRMLGEEELSRMFSADGPWSAVRNVGDAQRRRLNIVLANAATLDRVRIAHVRTDLANLADGSDVMDARIAAVAEEFRARLGELCDMLDAGAALPGWADCDQ
jgi:hypothetical protein